MTSSVCSRLGSLLSLLFLAAVLGVTCETADFTSTRSYFRYFQTKARSAQNNCGAFDVSACTRFKILAASREGPGGGGIKVFGPHLLQALDGERRDAVLRAGGTEAGALVILPLSAAIFFFQRENLNRTRQTCQHEKSSD